jgi:hypothetical protein
VLTTEKGPVITGEREVEMVLNRGLRDKAIAGLNKFLSMGTIEERLTMVRLPSRVEPFMRAYHAERGLETFTIDEAKLAKRAHIRCGGDVASTDFIFLGVTLRPGFRQQIFSIENRDGEMLIDWETSYGHQIDSLERFQELRNSAGTAVFRCTLIPSDLYTNAFEDSSKWTCFKLENGGESLLNPDRPFSLYGFVNKRSAVGVKVRELFLGKESDDLIRAKVNAIIKVKYPSRVVSPDQVEIVDVVNDTWFYSDRAAGKDVLAAGPDE